MRITTEFARCNKKVKSRLTKLPCCVQAKLPSLSCRNPEHVMFHNTTSSDMVVLWLNYDRNEVCHSERARLLLFIIAPG